MKKKEPKNSSGLPGKQSNEDVNSKQSQQPEYDEAIMNELLSQPSIRKHVLKMKAGELKFYKQLLVSTGVYARYCAERVK